MGLETGKEGRIRGRGADRGRGFEQLSAAAAAQRRAGEKRAARGVCVWTGTEDGKAGGGREGRCVRACGSLVSLSSHEERRDLRGRLRVRHADRRRRRQLGVAVEPVCRHGGGGVQRCGTNASLIILDYIV